MSKVVFFSHKDTSSDEAEKNSLLQLSLCFSHFSFSSIHKAVGEAILLNAFSKTAQLHLQSCS